jgi:hypothetical protein
VVLALKGLTEYVTSVAFSPDGKRISGKEKTEDREKVLTWDAATGQVLGDVKPPLLEEQASDEEVTSPDGVFQAMLHEGKIRVIRRSDIVEVQRRQKDQNRAFLQSLARPDPEDHRRKADLFEKSGADFAAAFHLRLLLLIEANEEVRKRLAGVEARIKAAAEKQPARMPDAQ